ncbi:hypothetical protein CHLRE_07g317000v5 [Chlamydomonas reinhardtii]|uniref:Uncharacterized protein n=1 Tax=Chlamydomonas reinhardtii TaxID=3055 RepID=A8I6H7_CHLRE|nr:uncharacterized protein CHLRE_07g317000v5 [Chlamydomonas reinhardtii]PNW80421.1 hypothetical protein CHLRE_07g317000v5 [Chlamydomonas reinhardtii]|eukprot:XP_001700814.1 predicted protein [Chlamydomonas reinhardtii]
MALATAGKEGGHDAVREHLETLFLGQQNAHLLDDVIVGFVNTNEFKQRRYTVQELMTCAPSWGRPKHFKFVHAEIPYLATVDFWEGSQVDFVVIRLPNNGFTYRNLPCNLPCIMSTAPGAAPLRAHAHSGRHEEEEIHRHRHDGWVELDGTLLMEFFPGLAKSLGANFTSILFFYNYKHQRIDMQLFTDDSCAPGLMLTFELGYPYVDDQCQRRPLRRL